MARINVRTLRFQLSLSFTALSVLVLALVVVTILRLSGVMQQGIHIMRIVQPTEMWTEKLRADIQSANSHLQYHLATNDTSFLDLSKSIWKEEIPAALEKIEGFEPEWRQAEYRVGWAEIKFKLENLEALQQELRNAETPDAAQSIFNEKIHPATLELDRQLVYLFETVREDAIVEGDRLVSEIYGFFFTEGTTYIIIVLIIWLLYSLLNRRVKQMIKKVQAPVAVLSDGNLPEAVSKSEDEVSGVLTEIKELTDNLRNVKNFALEVGKGNFDTELSVFNNSGEIGSSLAEMRESLRRVDVQDKERDWVNTGFNKFGELIRRYGNNLDKLTEELIKELVKFLDANQGGFFVAEGPEDDIEQRYLELKSAFAYDRQKYDAREIKFGEGLLGQAWQEKELVSLSKLPPNYMHITSGLGYATPNHLVLVPLVTNEKVYGMFEIASFSPLPQYRLDFLRGLGETVAAALNSVKVNDNTRRLLDESQELTEQMRSQEEEMRQNMEELQATQEEMKRNANDSENKVTRLTTILNSTADPVITVSANGIIDAFNHAAESLFGYNANEILDHNIGVLLPEEKVIRRELTETSNSPVERAKVITRRRMEGIRKGGKRFLAEVAVKDTFYDGQKHFTVLVRDVSTDQERMDELDQSNRKLSMELEVAMAEQGRMQMAQKEMRLRHQALDRSLLSLDIKPSGIISNSNMLIRSTLHLNERAVDGQPLRSLLPDYNTPEDFESLWNKIFAADGVYLQDLKLVGASDITIWVRCSFIKVMEGDEVLKVLFMGQDISSQKDLLDATQQEISRLQSAEGGEVASDSEARQRLQELQQVQQEVQSNLAEILKRNEARLREAIAQQEARWKK